MGVISQNSVKSTSLNKATSRNSINYQQKLGQFLKLLLASLVGIFITGVGMVSIGQPSSTHIISSGGNTFWHFLLVLHMIFLALMTISALLVLATAIASAKALRKRAILGLAVIAFGSVSGSLSFQSIHPAFFLFCVAMSFLALGAIYGPLLGQMLAKKN